MKNLLKILVLVIFLTSGCYSDEYLFGRPFWGAPDNIEVSKGDTLYSISKKYDIPLNTLAELNNIEPPYTLIAGQTIKLKDISNEEEEQTSSDEEESNVKKHRVSKGDTLYSIAKKYNVPLRDLIETNNLSPPYSLGINQYLEIPSNRFHIVGKGDTLYSISKKYDVDITSLSRMNNLKAPYTLSVGDKLVLSGAISSTQTKKTVKNNKKQNQTVKKSAKKTASKKVAVNTKTVKKLQTPKKTQTIVRQTKTTYMKPVSTNRTAKFSWPVKGPVISSYGTIGKGRKNDGINIKAPLGATVNAADKGIVVYAGNELKGFGNLILLKHPDGWITAYAHNDRIFVRKGQSVRRGEKISTVGRTGGVSDPQLHFEIHINKKPINPLPYLQ